MQYKILDNWINNATPLIVTVTTNAISLTHRMVLDTYIDYGGTLYLAGDDEDFTVEVDTSTVTITEDTITFQDTLRIQPLY